MLNTFFAAFIVFIILTLVIIAIDIFSNVNFTQIQIKMLFLGYSIISIIIMWLAYSDYNDIKIKIASCLVSGGQIKFEHSILPNISKSPTNVDMICYDGNQKLDFFSLKGY